MPEPITSTINEIGLYTFSGAHYAHTIEPDIWRNNRFIPVSKSVRFSNMRDIITALAAADTTEEVRIAFETHCPIPGAQWLNHRLMNADEIMPANYTLENLADDIALLDAIKLRIAEKFPKYMNPGKLN